MTCRRCDSDLDAAGYCTATEWCPYSDRLQAGSPPGARTALDIARSAYDAANVQLDLFAPEYVRASRLA